MRISYFFRRIHVRLTWVIHNLLTGEKKGKDQFTKIHVMVNVSQGFLVPLKKEGGGREETFFKFITIYNE